MKFLIDSSAWIEYLEGSIRGEKVDRILKENNEIITLPINVAEVISYTSRKKSNVNSAYDIIIRNSKQFNPTPKISKEAGLLHAEEKAKSKSFSLADAFMIISAKAISAKLVTKDSHFKRFREVVLL